jgi:hypothetical protein
LISMTRKDIPLWISVKHLQIFIFGYLTYNTDIQCRAAVVPIKAIGRRTSRAEDTGKQRKNYGRIGTVKE